MEDFLADMNGGNRAGAIWFCFGIYELAVLAVAVVLLRRSERR